MGKQVVGNLANNLTGGIAASLSQTEITKLQGQYISDGIGVITFIEYLARAHQLAGEPGWVGSNSDTITSPNLQIDFFILCSRYTTSIDNIKGRRNRRNNGW